MGFDTVSWPEFMRTLRWTQGQHVSIIKPTGGGKSTLLGEVVKVHRSPAIVVFVTKVHDETIKKMFPASDGWKRVEKWPPPRHIDKVLLWPRPGSTIPETKAIQKRVFREALDSIFLERGWTVVFDEEHYTCVDLGLSEYVAMFHHQGRSSGLTCANGIQRPKFVPLITYSSSTHAWVGQTNDEDDLKRIGAMGGKYKKDVIATCLDLDFFEFLYLPCRVPKGVPLRTTVEVNARAA